jgi:hypothetical protein
VVKQPGHDNDHLPLHGAKFMNEWSYTSLLSYAFVVCVGTTVPSLYHTKHINTLSGKMQRYVISYDRWYLYLLLAVLPVLNKNLK